MTLLGAILQEHVGFQQLYTINATISGIPTVHINPVLTKTNI